MASKHTVLRLKGRFSSAARSRSRALRAFYKSVGFVLFGAVHQHEDDIEVIRGFTASLSHQDTNFAVGTYDDYAVRVVSRSDVIHPRHSKPHLQHWTILEIGLKRPELRHVFFVPTGHQASEYSRFFEAQPHMQPLNSLLVSNKSSEFHGRFQIMARMSHSHEIEHFLTSPVILGMATRFWPHGIEIEHGKLLVYLTDARLTKTTLESVFNSALWLAKTIDEGV